MDKNTSYDPQKEFEGLLNLLEAGGPHAENLLRNMLANSNLYQISTTIFTFIREEENRKKAKELIDLLKLVGERDISTLHPDTRTELSRIVAEYLRNIASYVPDNKRSDFCKSLVESILTSYSSGKVERQYEYRPLPATQTVPQAQTQAASTQNTYQQSQPAQPVSQSSGAQPQAGGQYPQQSSVLTYEEFEKIREEEKLEERIAKRLKDKNVYLSDGREGRIVGYHKKPSGLYIYVEREDGTWYGLTLEDLKKYLEKSSGKSNRSYLILPPIALSGLLPLLFLRTSVSSLLLLPSKHHFLPVFILLLSLALFLLAKRALK